MSPLEISSQQPQKQRDQILTGTSTLRLLARYPRWVNPGRTAVRLDTM